MRLDEYLSHHKISLRVFASSTGLGLATISRARNGVGLGSRRTMTAIVRATGGEVTISDLVATAVENDPEAAELDQAQIHNQGTISLLSTQGDDK